MLKYVLVALLFPLFSKVYATAVAEEEVEIPVRPVEPTGMEVNSYDVDGEYDLEGDELGEDDYEALGEENDEYENEEWEDYEES